jgi:hypothetical protein
MIWPVGSGAEPGNAWEPEVKGTLVIAPFADWSVVYALIVNEGPEAWAAIAEATK